jgi:L-rhamnose 1-dehydrogenase
MALLENKVVAITGSSRGIGRACALESAKQGSKAIILHFLGDTPTADEVKALQSEIAQTYGALTIAVAGDIGQQETSIRVRLLIHAHTPF